MNISFKPRVVEASNRFISEEYRHYGKKRGLGAIQHEQHFMFMECLLWVRCGIEYIYIYIYV